MPMVYDFVYYMLVDRKKPSCFGGITGVYSPGQFCLVDFNLTKLLSHDGSSRIVD